MNFWRSLTGMMEVEITSAEPEYILDISRSENIHFFQIIRKSDLIYKLQIHRSDYYRFKYLMERRGNTLQVTRRLGLYWKLTACLHRPVLLTGLIILLGSALYLPSKILFVKVDGNASIPSQQILSAAEDCGIRWNTSRKTVRSEQVKNALLSALPQLQWAGVNTSGCVATITVRERKEEPEQSESEIVSNIIADRDGYIVSGTVTSGNALFQPGDTVRKGEILISGYTDCGIVLQATRAAGEIRAITNRKLISVFPAEYSQRNEITRTQRRYSLLLGKKRINFWKYSRIPDGNCGRMYEEYYVTLPGGFRLPIAICVDQYVQYNVEDSITVESDAYAQLAEFSDGYLLSRMIAGQITEKRQKKLTDNCLYVLERAYTCLEMIGKEQQEQIGDWNGKRN